jgi:hypothetical protein
MTADRDPESTRFWEDQRKFELFEAKLFGVFVGLGASLVLQVLVAVLVALR